MSFWGGGGLIGVFTIAAVILKSLDFFFLPGLESRFLGCLFSRAC